MKGDGVMLKRTFILLLTVFIIMPSLYIGALGEYGVEPYVFFYAKASEISENNTVDISVYTNCDSEVTVGGIQLCLSYDYRNLSYVKDSAVFGEDFSSSQVGFGYGSFNYTWDSVTGADLSGSNILIFKATFALAEDIEDGDYSFDLYAEELYAADDKLSDIQSEAYGCSVWVGERLEIYPDYVEGPYGSEIQLFWTDGKQIDNWYSTNEKVATVDNDGIVKLISIGTATIIAIGGINGQESAYCRVTVNNRRIYILSVVKNPLRTDYVIGDRIDLSGLELKIGYDNYDIEHADSGFVCEQGVDYDFSTPGEKNVKVHYGDSWTYIKVTVHDSYGISSSVYSVQDGYITGVSPLTELSEFIENLKATGEIKVYSGEEEVTGGLVATGMTVSLNLSGTTVQTLKIAVTGDINCDGECDILDLIRIKKGAAGMVTLDTSQLKAAGATCNYPNAQDIIRVQKQIINS